MSEIPLEQPSALNLTLRGGAGRFQIGSGTAQSLEVLYFLTNVGLAIGQGVNDHLLSELAPVREVFRTDELGFDELMQRDIDDSRVTSELVPYLLDYQTAGMVKLFPPIVVMVLPKAYGEDRPLRLYPATTEYTVKKGDVDTNDSFQSFGSRANRPLLHRKEEFLDPDDPGFAKYRRLTAAEVRAGLYQNPTVIGLEEGWEAELQRCGVAIRGHRVIKRR